MPDLPAEICRALGRGGWLPVRPDGTRIDIRPGRDLLPQLASLGSRPTAEVAADLPMWLREQVERGAQLVWGICPGNGSTLASWVRQRLAWWPLGVPEGPWVAVVSSRLGRRLECRANWFAALRRVFTSLKAERAVLMTASGTAAAAIVARASRLYDLPLLTITVADDSQELVGWLRRLRRTGADDVAATWRVCLSPPICGASRGATASARLRDVPARDIALAAMADRLEVLALRPGGHVERLVRCALSDRRRKSYPVRLAVGPQLVPPRLSAELQRSGADCWRFDPGPNSRPGSRPDLSLRPSAVTENMPPWEPGEYLIHWTRSCVGPWPDETEAEFLDRLIRGEEETDHSAWAALSRIVRQQRIIASRHMIRGATPVVCFTAIPWSEFPQRVFRRHRRRWDCEPYGMCIQRQWLEVRGTRPVRYGDDAEWAGLSADERPFFQLQATRPSKARTSIDWTCEREWRHANTVELDALPAQAGWLFVSSRAEAEALACLSRWPVGVLGQRGIPDGP